MDKLWIPIIFLLGASCMRNDKLRALDEVREGLVGIKGAYDVRAAPERKVDMHTRDIRWEGVAEPICNGYIQSLEKNQDSAIVLYENARVMAESIYHYGSPPKERKEQIKNLDPLIFQLAGDAHSEKGNKEDSLTASKYYNLAEKNLKAIGCNEDFDELKLEETKQQ